MRDPRDYFVDWNAAKCDSVSAILRHPYYGPFRTSVKCSYESVRRLLRVFVAIRPPFG